MKEEIGDDGFYVRETEQSERYLDWTVITDYRKMDFSVEEMARFLGKSVDYINSVINEFDLDLQD